MIVMKTVENSWKKGIDKGKTTSTDIMNSIYQSRTTHLLFIPWLPRKIAHYYAIQRGRWERGKDLDLAGRRGTTYFSLIKWLKPFHYRILNLDNGFTSNYLKSHNRLNSRKRKMFFKIYSIIEIIFAKYFKVPITAFLPYIDHLFIRKLVPDPTQKP